MRLPCRPFLSRRYSARFSGQFSLADHFFRAWMEMPGLISDEMLQTFAVVAPPDGIAQGLKARYEGLADRLTLYLPFIPGDRDDFWRKLIADMQES